MATRWESVNVQCPFYLGNDDRTIRCEGLTEGETVTRRFSGAVKRKACMAKCCCGKYRECPVYKLVYMKYNT